MKPSSLGRRFVASVGKRDVPRCSYPSPLSSLSSHTQRGVTSSTSLLQGKMWTLGNVKIMSFKEKLALSNSAPFHLPLDRAMCNVTPSQMRTRAHLNFYREGEPYGVCMPYRWLRGLSLGQERPQSEDEVSKSSVLGLREQQDFQTKRA